MVARAQAGSIGVRAISCSARRQREVVTLLPACALAVRATASSVPRHRADVAARSVAPILLAVVVAARFVLIKAARLVVVPPLVARSLEARSIAVDSVNA